MCEKFKNYAAAVGLSCSQAKFPLLYRLFLHTNESVVPFSTRLFFSTAEQIYKALQPRSVFFSLCRHARSFF